MTDGQPKAHGPLGLIALVFKGAWLVLSRTALLFLTIGFLLLVGLFFSAIGSSDGPLAIENGSALRLPLTAAVVERAHEPGALAEAFGADADPDIGLRDIATSLRAAATDERIAGVVVELGGPLSLTHARDVASMLRDFKVSGKPVYAHGVVFGQNQLVVAAAADDVVIHNDGFFWLPGYSIKPLYFKTLLDNLSVDVDVFRVGTFKAAVEPYLQDEMSDAARANYRELGEGLFAAARADIGEGRELSDEALVDLVREAPARLVAAGGDFAAAAIEAGLVDRRASLTEIRADLVKRFGETADGGYRAVDARDYAEETRGAAPPEPRDPSVGVIYVDGAITLGESEDGVAGSGSITRQLRRAAGDDDVKAIVLRVNSPGGSALASEFIREEVLAVKAAGKPVIVSMGPSAASGGYWIAADADEIWAAPTTVTGSIGVFLVLPNVHRALARIGVRADGVAFAQASDLGSPVEPLDDASREALQASVEDSYRKFLSVVAGGRGMAADEVDAAGQGRVWIGAKALELGLVDRMGGFEDAVRAAAERAGLERWSVFVYEDEETPFEAFVNALVGAAGPELARFAGLDPALIRSVSGAASPLAGLGRDLAADPLGRAALCTACLALER